MNDYAVLLRRLSSLRPWPWSSPTASAASPSTPRPTATRSRGRSRCWPPTSRRTRRCPGCVEAAAAALAGVNRYPDPTNAALRKRCPTATSVPANRIAIGNGSCDILLAAGEALLEPGAELVYAWPSFSVYPHLAAASGARAIEVPLDERPPPRPGRDGEGDHRRHAAGDRLQPEQPDLDGAPARRDRRVRRARAAPRRGDPRRGLRRVQPPPGPRGRRSSCSSSTRTSCCCARSRRSTGCAACGSATRCAARRSSAPPSTRCASPSSATPPRRPPRSRRSTTRTRSTRRVERNLAERRRSVAELAGIGIELRRVARQLRLVRPAGRRRGGARSSTELGQRSILVRAGAAARPRGRAARHGRHPGRERALRRGARRAA